MWQCSHGYLHGCEWGPSPSRIRVRVRVSVKVRVRDKIRVRVVEFLTGLGLGS